MEYINYIDNVIETFVKKIEFVINTCNCYNDDSLEISNKNIEMNHHDIYILNIKKNKKKTIN